MLSEILAAGEENFELDHFRPKSRFPHLLNDFYNIYYSCHPCNHTKRDLWPSQELEARGIFLVDLCHDDFTNHFSANEKGEWGGLTESGRYTIDILRLNRSHLKIIRQLLGELGIAVHDRVRGRFTEQNLKVLTALASMAGIRVENARIAEEQIERERVEREQRAVSEFQQRFHLPSPPRLAGYELQWISFPCYEIGGDYYDFVQRKNGALMVTLGEVAGRGASAALLMSTLHTAVHTEFDAHKSLKDTIQAVNQNLVENISANRFATLFTAELDPTSGDLTFLNAGHLPALLVHADGTNEQLALGGLPLGVLMDAEYHQGSARLQPGDVLVIYSDGVSEAVNPNDEEFGFTRIYEVVARNLDDSAARIREGIESALTNFCQGTPARDDVTLVIVKRLRESIVEAE